MCRRTLVIGALIAGLAFPSAARAQGVLAPLPPPKKPAGATAHRQLKDACSLPVVAIACSVGGTALGAVGDVVGAGVDAVGGAAMNGLSNWVADGASWLIGRIA